jgi:uncharacterized membrane protein YbhN (UPF0104 family)
VVEQGASPIDPPAEEQEVLAPTPRGRLALKIIGFVVGVGLLGWIIYTAIINQQFEGLKDAEWWQYALLIGCTLVSVAANGGIFWAIIRPVAPVRLWDIQCVNAAVNLLNYAPVRLGLVTRIAHHRRVDRLPYSILLGWYAALGGLMFMTLGCVLAATLIRPQVDLLWIGVMSGLLVVGCAASVWVGSHRLLAGRWRGASKMIAVPRAVALAVILRLVDMAAYGGRLYVAITILGVSITPRDAVFLTLISMVSTLAPVGSLGFREFAIARLGPLLTDTSLKQHIDAAVLLDRAGEVVIFIPLGVLALIWMARAWRRCDVPAT